MPDQSDKSSESGGDEKRKLRSDSSDNSMSEIIRPKTTNSGYGSIGGNK